MQETWVQFLGWEDPLEKEMRTHSCLGNPMDRGTWWAMVRGITRVGHNLTTKIITHIVQFFLVSTYLLLPSQK